jgi:hypothetical protein
LSPSVSWTDPGAGDAVVVAAGRCVVAGVGRAVDGVEATVAIVEVTEVAPVTEVELPVTPGPGADVLVARPVLDEGDDAQAVAVISAATTIDAAHARAGRDGTLHGLIASSQR